MALRRPYIVIPGRAESASPESNRTLRAFVWIPGPLAARASRNDGETNAEDI
jgi:hypothetical protein